MSYAQVLIWLSNDQTKSCPMKRITFLFVIASLFMMSSCSKQLTYLTEKLYDDHQWSEPELKQIQFYVSEDIVLYRASKSGNSTIQDGKIRINSDHKVEEVRINSGTPGTLIFSPKEDRFAICFDKDSDKYLMFGPHKKARGRFVLMAKKWNKREGIITYGGEEYYTDSNSAYAALMVDIDKAQRSVTKTNTARGRQVN